MGQRELITGAVNRPLLICGVVAAVVVLSSPLTSSLWLDESLSSWITNGSFDDVFYRSFEYQGQSPLYFIILWGARQFLGASELALRTPSIIAFFASLFLVYRIVFRISGAQSAAAALVFFCALDPVRLSAISARPYSILLFGVLFSTWNLLRWMDTGRKLFHVWYAVGLIAVGYLHYFYLGIVLIHLLVVVLERRESRVSITVFLATVFGVLVVMLPSLPHLLSVLGRQDLYRFSNLPQWMDFLSAIAPPYLLVYLVFGIVFGRIMVPFERNEEERVRVRTIFWLGVWYLLPVVIYYVYSIQSGNSLFFWRQYLWYSIGLAALWGITLGAIHPPRAFFLVLSCVSLLVVVREVGRRWELEDWKGAVRFLNSVREESPVLAYTGLIELENPGWVKSPFRVPYLQGPLGIYAVDRPVVLIPSDLDRPEMSALVSEKIEPTLTDKASFDLLCMSLRSYRKFEDGPHSTCAVLKDQLSRLGWTSFSRRDFGVVRVESFLKNVSNK